MAAEQTAAIGANTAGLKSRVEGSLYISLPIFVNVHKNPNASTINRVTAKGWSIVMLVSNKRQ